VECASFLAVGVFPCCSPKSRFFFCQARVVVGVTDFSFCSVPEFCPSSWLSCHCDLNPLIFRFALFTGRGGLRSTPCGLFKFFVEASRSRAGFTCLFIPTFFFATFPWDGRFPLIAFLWFFFPSTVSLSWYFSFRRAAPTPIAPVGASLSANRAPL